jgi:hypothetical protein
MCMQAWAQQAPGTGCPCRLPLPLQLLSLQHPCGAHRLDTWERPCTAMHGRAWLQTVQSMCQPQTQARCTGLSLPIPGSMPSPKQAGHWRRRNVEVKVVVVKG